MESGQVCRGRGKDGRRKASSLPVPRLREYGKRADLTLLEADGSRRKPMKVPAEREPVILPECDLVLGVIGLSCLGKPLREVWFRPELACTLFGAELEEIVGKAGCRLC